MNKPSSRYLSYQCSLFKGVSFSEFSKIASTGTISCFLMGMVLGLLLGHWAMCTFLIGVIGGVVSIFLLPRQFAKIKKGKPHGYLDKIVRLKLIKLHLIDNPYTNYQGVWKKSKRFRG